MRAPAGYGKTSVLHQWAAAERRPVAWVDVTDTDNDPDVLLSSVTAAVIAATKPAADAGRAGRSHRARVAAAPLDQSIVLVLDNADVLVAPEALAALERSSSDSPRSRRSPSRAGRRSTCLWAG